MKPSELENTETLINQVQSYLRTPNRIAEIERESDDLNLGQELGSFLINKGCLKKISLIETDDEEFLPNYDINEKTIMLNKKTMSVNHWRDYIYRKQTFLKEGESYSLFPMHPMYNPDEDETKKYLFLNATVQAYREHIKKEGLSKPLTSLIEICYQKRKLSTEKDLPRKAYTRGFSLRGSHPQYFNEHKEEEYISRALIDVDELITMYIWNPKFFEGYINYLSSKPKEILYKKKLCLIKDSQEAEEIKSLVNLYIEQMKEII